MLLETTTAESLTGIAAWAVGIMTTLGGPGAAFLIALENLFPPLPSEVILPLAGFSAGTGTSSMTISHSDPVVHLRFRRWCMGPVRGGCLAGTGPNPPDPDQGSFGQDL